MVLGEVPDERFRELIEDLELAGAVSVEGGELVLSEELRRLWREYAQVLTHLVPGLSTRDVIVISLAWAMLTMLYRARRRLGFPEKRALDFSEDYVSDVIALANAIVDALEGER